MIIQPGEPCDLVMNEWIPIYRYLGREKTIELIKRVFHWRKLKN